MRILLFSDSHGYTQNMVKAIQHQDEIDIIIHLGDFLRDAVKVEAMYKDIPFHCVAGNNDWGRELPAEKVLALEGRKIWLTHGHLYGVKSSRDRLISKAREMGMDAVFYGHTHLTEEIYTEGLLVLNPGSISAPVQPYNASYCIVEVNNDGMKVRFFGV